MINIKAVKQLDADEKAGSIRFEKSYLYSTGLELRELKIVQRESDFTNGAEYRISLDNGKVFGEWTTLEKNLIQNYGDDEMTADETDRVWNPVHKHFVYTHFTRYFLGNHKDAYKASWGGEKTYFDHQYIVVTNEKGDTAVSKKLMMYEDGVDFDPENPRNPDFLYKNIGFLNQPAVMRCGDIIVPVGIPVSVGCRMAGLDVQRVFPSCPDKVRCVIVARGKFNPGTKEYDFTFSNPVILSDLRSSRGIDEPIIIELKSGRLLLVMRGANTDIPAWSTRIEPGTPAFKWYSYSDDGGKTFTEAEPWRFDNREVIYSPASISKFVRSAKNGKLYWIGNVTPPTTYGNFPRFPLNIAEVDETLGILKRDTLTVIDTRREGETDEVQLSNFFVFEDRESGILELTLSKIGQFDKSKEGRFFCESWKYEIDFE